jgi:hypothetical protein
MAQVPSYRRCCLALAAAGVAVGVVACSSFGTDVAPAAGTDASLDGGGATPADGAAEGDGALNGDAVSEGGPATQIKTVCFELTNVKQSIDANAGVVTTTVDSVKVDVAATSAAAGLRSVRAYSEQAVPTSLEGYGAIRLRAHFATTVVGSSATWPTGAYVSVLGVAAGPFASIDTAGKFALLVVPNSLDVSVYPTGSNGPNQRQPLVPSYPTTYESDVSVVAPLGNAGATVSAQIDGGLSTSLMSSLTTFSGKTVTLYVGGYAGDGNSATHIEVTMLCADLLP